MKKMTGVVLIILCVAAIIYVNFDKKTRAIQTKKDKQFIIALKTNPSTGYQWQVNYDVNCIELIKRKYLKLSNAKPPITGEDKQEIFVFKALRLTKTEIKFSYLKPWEKDAKPLKEILYRVLICKQGILVFRIKH